MREGETVASFANRFKGLVPQVSDVNWNIVQYVFLKKLPIEARTRPVKDLFEEKKSFKDLSGECNKVHKLALSDRSNKRSRTQVNAVHDDDEEAEQEEEEQAAVNLVSGGASQQWKSKRARTDQGKNLAPDAKVFAAVCQPHQRFGTKACCCLGNGCPFEKMLASPPRDPREYEDRETAEDEHATKSSVLVHSKRTSQQRR